MDQLQRILAGIQVNLGKLSPSQKLLLGSVAIILLMTLMLVSAYTGTRNMVDVLPGATSEQVTRAQTVLAGYGIEHQVENGRLMVPAAAQTVAVSRLEEGRAMPQDSRAILFENLAEKQTWQNSKQQNDQLFNIATQNELARVISNFTDVRSAEVILDVPAASGLGMAMRTPTASVTAFTNSGAPLSQSKVDAIAEMVAGSRAGLDPRNVRVIDGTTGRSRRPTDEDTLLSGDYTERSNQVENMVRNKLLEQVLHYIPGVQVAVTASVDVTKVQKQTKSYMPEGNGSLNLIKSESSGSQQSRMERRSAEPGIRSNATADINRGGNGGSQTDVNDALSEFNPFPGQVVETVTDPRGMPTMLAVSVNIPRSYIEDLLTEAAGGDEGAEAEPPTEEDVLLKFEEIEPVIRNNIRPHVATLTTTSALSPEQIDQQISIELTTARYVAPAAPASAGLLGMVAGGGGGGGMLGFGGALVDRVVMIGLALFAMTMMVMLVRKAGKQLDLPSAEELVGVPPPLENVGDLIGEADEGDMPLDGVEIDDDQVQKNKMLEQVGQLVTDDPDTASRLLNRWITTED